MRGWLWFLLTGILVLIAPAGAQRGGLLDGVAGNNIMVAGLFFLLAFAVRPTEEGLIQQAGDRAGSCGVTLIHGLMIALLVLLALWFLAGAPEVGGL